MIQFDLRIFFRWVAKNHQLENLFNICQFSMATLQGGKIFHNPRFWSSIVVGWDWKLDTPILGLLLAKDWVILLMAEIRRENQLRLVVYPIIYRVSYIPGGAGFLPSTVVVVFKTRLQSLQPRCDPWDGNIYRPPFPPDMWPFFSCR